jgi:hypothetical protein
LRHEKKIAPEAQLTARLAREWSGSSKPARPETRDTIRVLQLGVLEMNTYAYLSASYGGDTIRQQFSTLGIFRTTTPVLSQNLNPDILVMQPTQNCDACDAAELLWASKIRRILVQ